MLRPSPFYRRLLDSDRGAVAPFFFFSVLLILAASLGGIDLVRYSVAQGRLQNALDGATLSAGRNLANLSAVPTVPEYGTWQNDAYEFFRANMPQGYMGSTIHSDELHIDYDDEMSGDYVIGQIIRMQAGGELPLLSTGFLKVAALPLRASNEALRRTRSDLELVMALDNTGSMDAEQRLVTLKTAARDLSATVLGASEASGIEGRVFVGLVPFAETVNVGANAHTRQWLQTWTAGRSERQHFVNNLWSGCIAEPYWTPNTQGKLPAAVWGPRAGFQPLAIVPHTAITRGDLGLSARSNNYERPIASASGRPQPRAFTLPHRELKDVSAPFNTSSTSTSASLDYFTVYSWANPEHCREERAVLFLTDNSNAINSAIRDMYADGGTIIPTGLLWAWRMLDPGWRGSPGWGDPDKPRDPEPKVLSKVIVLLTDGDNDASKPPNYGANIPHTKNRTLSTFQLTYDIQRCTSSNFRTGCTTVRDRVSTISNKAVNRSAQSYQYPMNSLRVRSPDDTSTTTPSTTIGYRQNHIEPAAMDSYLADLCTAVKNDGNGIKIYTVTLGQLKQSTNNLMRSCSSGASYAYNADNVRDLPVVFKSIAGALTELRLTK